jgi:hypothetical protein
MLIIVIVSFILSACGAKAVPTIDSAQMQASAIAMVNTFVAMTQAAITPTPIPTNTPLPSPTSLPSPTPSPLPTLGTELPAATQSGADSCNGPLGANPGTSDAGKNVKGTNILIVNNTKVSITFSLYLVKNINGQCGYVSYVIARGNSMLVSNTLPKGCYYGHAFSDDPKKPFQVSSGPDCITGPDKTTFAVTENLLKVTGP